MVLVYLSEGGWEGTLELELRSPYLVVVGDVRAWGLLEEELRCCTGVTLSVVTSG